VTVDIWLTLVFPTPKAPVYGCGCWAAKSTMYKRAKSHVPVSIAASSSGPGEILTKLQFAKRCSDAVNSPDCDNIVKGLSDFVRSAVLGILIFNYVC